MPWRRDAMEMCCHGDVMSWRCDVMETRCHGDVGGTLAFYMFSLWPLPNRHFSSGSLWSLSQRGGPADV